MAAIEYTLFVLMEDDTRHEVTADQRDVAAWEMQPFGTSGNEVMSKVNLFMRFAAWNSMKRRKETKLTWEQFSQQCVEVIDSNPDDAEDDGDAGGAVDPGQTASTDAS